MYDDICGKKRIELVKFMKKKPLHYYFENNQVWGQLGPHWCQGLFNVSHVGVQEVSECSSSVLRGVLKRCRRFHLIPWRSRNYQRVTGVSKCSKSSLNPSKTYLKTFETYLKRTLNTHPPLGFLWESWKPPWPYFNLPGENLFWQMKLLHSLTVFLCFD